LSLPSFHRVSWHDVARRRRMQATVIQRHYRIHALSQRVACARQVKIGVADSGMLGQVREELAEAVRDGRLPQVLVSIAHKTNPAQDGPHELFGRARDGLSSSMDTGRLTRTLAKPEQPAPLLGPEQLAPPSEPEQPAPPSGPSTGRPRPRVAPKAPSAPASSSDEVSMQFLAFARTRLTEALVSGHLANVLAVSQAREQASPDSLSALREQARSGFTAFLAESRGDTGPGPSEAILAQARGGLLASLDSGRLAQALSAQQQQQQQQHQVSATKICDELVLGASDGRLDSVLRETHRSPDVSVVRDRLLRSSEDGNLARVLQASAGATPDVLHLRESLTEAASNGELQAVLAARGGVPR